MTKEQTQRLDQLANEKEIGADSGFRPKWYVKDFKAGALAWQKELASAEVGEFFDFQQSPWWKDMEKQLCVDGWPQAVVVINSFINKAKEQTSATVAALKAENEDLKRLLNQYDEHVLSVDATNKIVSDRATIAEQTALLRECLHDLNQWQASVQPVDKSELTNLIIEKLTAHLDGAKQQTNPGGE